MPEFKRLGRVTFFFSAIDGKDQSSDCKRLNVTYDKFKWNQTGFLIASHFFFFFCDATPPSAQKYGHLWSVWSRWSMATAQPQPLLCNARASGLDFMGSNANARHNSLLCNQHTGAQTESECHFFPPHLLRSPPAAGMDDFKSSRHIKGAERRRFTGASKNWTPHFVSMSRSRHPQILTLNASPPMWLHALDERARFCVSFGFVLLVCLLNKTEAQTAHTFGFSFNEADVSWRDWTESSGCFSAAVNMFSRTTFSRRDTLLEQQKKGTIYVNVNIGLWKLLWSPQKTRAGPCLVFWASPAF